NTEIINTGLFKGPAPTEFNERRAAGAAHTTNEVLSANEAHAHAGAREDKSVVTRVRVAGVANVPRGGSRRALGVAAGVVVVALVAAAVYSFSRRVAGVAPAEQQSAPQVTIQPSPTVQQSAAPSDNTQTTDTANAHDATNAAQPRHTPAATAHASKPQNEKLHVEEEPRPAPAQPPQTLEEIRRFIE